MNLVDDLEPIGWMKSNASECEIGYKKVDISSLKRSPSTAVSLPSFLQHTSNSELSISRILLLPTVSTFALLYAFVEERSVKRVATLKL